MTIELKIARGLYHHIRRDLTRPHFHAAERVGFLYCREAQFGDATTLVLVSSYVPVADDLYIRDRKVGARIDGEAIRRAMEAVMETGWGCFHVHMHDHKGTPALSLTDQREIPRIIESLSVVRPEQVHGIFLLSKDRCVALVRPPHVSKLAPATRISVVGYPLEIIEGV